MDLHALLYAFEKCYFSLTRICSISLPEEKDHIFVLTFAEKTQRRREINFQFNSFSWIRKILLGGWYNRFF